MDELDIKLIHLPANSSVASNKNERHRWIIIPNIGDKDEKQNISEEDIKRIEVREIQVEAEEVIKDYKNYNAFIPVCDFSWEGYQTAASDAGHATTLAKEIASGLNLIGQPQTFDLFTKDALQATFNISDQSGDYNNHQSMFYISQL